MANEGVRKYCTAIEGYTQAFRCNYCQIESKGGGVTRMKYHLSGNHPKKDIRGCTKVPPEVRDEMRQNLLEIRKKKEKKQYLDSMYKLMQKKQTTENTKLQSQDFEVKYVKSPPSPKVSRSVILKKLVENQSELQKIMIDMNRRVTQVEKNVMEGQKEQAVKLQILITQVQKNQADLKKNRSSETSYTVRAERENRGKRMEKPWNESSGFDQENNYSEAKRHKTLNYEQAENVSSSKPEIPEVPELIMIESSESSDECFDEHAVCAFCHSSEISLETGSMLHYSNEHLVSGQEARLSNVIHVHRLCINWSPLVFSVDGKAQNLVAEVEKGSKLECSDCGENGAALGCYVKSCPEKYHVPCALRVSECRWDYENYFMLCPSHSSVRFPKEKSKPAESCQLSDAALSDNKREWLLCGSDLSIKEKTLLVKFGNMDGSSVSKLWDPKVTHVIAATDENGACTRTFKVLMAILNGIWILKVDWIKACIEAKSHVDEEPFEISLDNYGSRDGPKTGRLRAFNNGPKLFGGLNFFFVGVFSPPCRKELEDLVMAGGGTLIKNREELSGQIGDVAVVIYNLGPPGESNLGEESSIMRRRLNEADDVAMQSRSRVIGHTWLLESIAAYRLQPFI